MNMVEPKTPVGLFHVPEKCGTRKEQERNNIGSTRKFVDSGRAGFVLFAFFWAAFVKRIGKRKLRF